MTTCPKCGGLMDKKGRGTDHNLRVENRDVLKAREGRTLVSQATRPLMYICEKCGFIEFYMPTRLGKPTKKNEKNNRRKRPVEDNHQYFT